MEGGVDVAFAGGIVTGWTGGEENGNEETDDKDEGVEDDKKDYNTMVAMMTTMTTITITLLLACMSYYLGSNGGQPNLSIKIVLALHMTLPLVV